MIGNILTIGQCAKLCKVTPRDASKWFDSGRLRGYRIPGSQNRRVPKEYLLRFLREQGMPIPAELADSEDEVGIAKDRIRSRVAELKAEKEKCWEDVYRAANRMAEIDKEGEKLLQEALALRASK